MTQTAFAITLTNSLPVIVSHTIIILNTSVATNMLPNSWNIYVIHLHIDKDKDDVSNYRPISLMPLFSKILGVAKQLLLFLEKQKLSNNQLFFSSQRY